ncbi:hypothetical protein NGM10_18005 (plasmid) [Halorussus salilacus]|uniref:hypothetical protein n=1 Tax=Halorussus salilacus TaxID=2953750 RepID=UPI00209D15AF|nr:hypothetical protein [Halorussus salilacus]USZ70186.1 hypothetical protein NGM10_18005 [Halorussus salilacus]
MSVSNSDRSITDTGQAGFLLALTVCSVLFALGFSVMIFGLTTPYLVTTADVVGVTATGIAMILLGSMGFYRLLSP